MILDVVFHSLLGVACGILICLLPGFSSNNLSMLFITYSLVSSDYLLAVTVIGIEISASFFEFLSPLVFGIGNEETSLLTDESRSLGERALSTHREDSLRKGMVLVSSGGVAGVALSFLMLPVSGLVYPLVYSSLKPLAGYILAMICAYMVWKERDWKKRALGAAMFSISGVFGLIMSDSGLLNPDFSLLPVFVGMYGLASMIHESISEKEIDGDEGPILDLGWKDKIGLAWAGFVSSLFATMLPSVKKGQASALAKILGNASGREEMLFLLPLVSLSFVTLSMLVMGTAGKVRGNLASDIAEVVSVSEVGIAQVLLFVGTIALSAGVSCCVIMNLAKPISKAMSHVNKKFIRMAGVFACVVLVSYFTGPYGLLVCGVSICIGLLSKRLRVKSVHLMAFLLLPTIIRMLSIRL
jgi:TctA family transporter